MQGDHDKFKQEAGIRCSEGRWVLHGAGGRCGRHEGWPVSGYLLVL
jgi:hypothetical protein